MIIQYTRPERIEEQYPVTYRDTEIRVIAQKIRDRKSVLVCGLGGSGKSHLLRFLAFHGAIPDTLDIPDIFRLYLDCNAIIDEDVASIFRALLLEVDPHITLPDSATAIMAVLRDVLATYLSQHSHMVIVLDRFERFSEELQPTMLDGLRHLRDYLDRRVSFVLGMRAPLNIAELSEEFDDLLSEPRTVWVGTLTEEDARWNVQTILNDQAITASADMIGTLTTISNGHPRLLRSVTLFWAEHRYESTVLQAATLLQNRQIARICEHIWEGLDPPSQQLAHQLVHGVIADLPADSLLHAHGFGTTTTKTPWPLQQSVLGAFIQQQQLLPQLTLTALEQRLWDIFQEQPETLFNREDLISTLYGHNPDGVNDEALVALVGRLRRKLTQAGIGTLEAIRGRGYRFVPTERADQI
ncbi:MAG: winged helix-turn-helix domain-containing protein [Chloroflexota bacterium]